MWKRVLACALVCLLLFSIAFCPYRPLTVTDPQLGALERDLREKYPHVAGLRVSVYRPTLYWDVTLSPTSWRARCSRTGADSQVRIRRS